MPNNNCNICNKLYWTKTTKKYCSKTCKDKARRTRANLKYTLNKDRNQKIALDNYYKNKDQILKKKKEWYLNNRENILKEKKRLYYDEIDKYRAAQRKRSQSPNYEKVRKERLKKHLSIDPDFLNKYYRNYKKRKKDNNDLNWILASLNRSRLSNALVSQQAFKNKKYSSFKYLGCTAFKLRQHLESQFKPGMNWKNRGKNGWHIDHIKPISAFDLTKPGELEKCFHYTNLQPLWAKENLKKSNKY